MVSLNDRTSPPGGLGVLGNRISCLNRPRAKFQKEGGGIGRGFSGGFPLRGGLLCGKGTLAPLPAPPPPTTDTK